METETRFIARYAETDQMGIVHHSNYTIWFEAGRTDFLSKAGIPNTKIEKRGTLLPLSHMECSFKNPAKYEDEIIVKTKIHKMSCVRIDFHYVIINGHDGRLLAEGTTSHAWTDNKLKPLNIVKKMPDLCERLKAALL